MAYMYLALGFEGLRHITTYSSLVFLFILQEPGDKI
jgi:hypothetical protein